MPTVEYLKTDDIMNMYKVKRATVKKWRDEGMPGYKIGRGVRFKEGEVEQWVMQHKNTQNQ
jgi:excisionase family DNA binding protein